MTCVECGSIMVKTPTGGGRCSNCGHVSNEPYKPIQAWDLGVGGAMLLDEELGKAKARIAELEAAVRLNAGRVYHVRYERTRIADGLECLCLCEDCQPFDHTDPGHDGMEELARLRELEASVLAEKDADAAYQATIGDSRMTQSTAETRALWSAFMAARDRLRAAIAACRAVREGT